MFVYLFVVIIIISVYIAWKEKVPHIFSSEIPKIYELICGTDFCLRKGSCTDYCPLEDQTVSCTFFENYLV